MPEGKETEKRHALERKRCHALTVVLGIWTEDMAAIADEAHQITAVDKERFKKALDNARDMIGQIDSVCWTTIL